MDAHEHVVAIANVAHDHRDVHVAGGTFERVNVEQAERRRQRDTNRFTASGGNGDHLGEHAAAVYPDPITGKLTRMGDGRSLWFVQPRSVEVRSEPLTPLGDRSGASSGPRCPESAVGPRCSPIAANSIPRLAVDETIGVLGGTFAYPFRYGYSCVGVVEQSRADARAEGTLVFAFHPHQDRFVADAADVVPLGSADPRRATMFPLVETALQITLDAGSVLGEQVVLFGLGAVGTLTAVLLQRAGARVLAVDTQPWRRDAAIGLGVDVGHARGCSPTYSDRTGVLPGCRSRSKCRATRTRYAPHSDCCRTRAWRSSHRGTEPRTCRCRSAATSTADD